MFEITVPTQIACTLVNLPINHFEPLFELDGSVKFVRTFFEEDTRFRYLMGMVAYEEEIEEEGEALLVACNKWLASNPIPEVPEDVPLFEYLYGYPYPGA